MTIALIVLAFAALVIVIIGVLLSAPGYSGPVTDHFDGKRFINIGNVRAKGLADVFKWLLTRQRQPWSPVSSSPNTPPSPTIDRGMRVTFINHTTFLLQVDGVNILIDPVYSERVSPFSFAGPRRMRPPGIPFAQLPHIHLVLISHNHYDHLDLPTVRELETKFKPEFVVPLGVAEFFKREGFSAVTELDWWAAVNKFSIAVTAVPAQHFSGRGMLDRDKTLWCGYVLQSSSGCLYFAGDSGYHGALFKNIGHRFPSIDVSIIPIGAYKPEWFMSPVHCSPSEAVQIHLDVKSRKSIASHFGTFPLADEGREEPVQGLRKALADRGLIIHEFICLDEGSYIDLNR